MQEKNNKKELLVVAIDKNKVNHGLLCQEIFYNTSKDQELISRISDYFKAYKSRNMYYVMFKKRAIDILLKHDLGPSKIGDLMNMHHSSVIAQRDRYLKPKGYHKFIKEHFWECIYNRVYPHYIGGNTNSNRKLRFNRVEKIAEIEREDLNRKLKKLG